MGRLLACVGDARRYLAGHLRNVSPVLQRFPSAQCRKPARTQLPPYSILLSGSTQLPPQMNIEKIFDKYRLEGSPKSSSPAKHSGVSSRP